MTEAPLKVNPSGEYTCLCVKRHVPEPRELHRHHVWPTGEEWPMVTGPYSVGAIR